MDLKELHEWMRREKFHYFEGNTNHMYNDLYLHFSTLPGGRGDCIEFRIGEKDNDMTFLTKKRTCLIKNIPDSELLMIMEANIL